MTHVAVVMRGPAGVGKSTIGNLLKSKISNSVHVDIDQFRQMISKESSDVRRTIARNVSRYFLEQLVENDYNVIIDEMFTDEAYYREILGILEDAQYQITTVLLTAPVETAIERDLTRAVKTKGAETISKLHARIQPFGDELLTVDTSAHTAEETAGIIAASVNSQSQESTHA